MPKTLWLGLKTPKQSMRAIFDRQFKKSLDKAPANIHQAFYDRLDLFLNNPFHPLLHNHSLKGSYQEYRSINISGDWRAIFRFLDEKRETVVFIDLGTHSQLYK